VYINIYFVLELGQRHGISHIPFNNRNTIEFGTDHSCLNHRCQGSEGRDVDIPENNRKTIEFVTSAVFKPSKYPYYKVLLLQAIVILDDFGFPVYVLLLPGTIKLFSSAVF